MGRPYTKPALTLEQQLDLLERRGLVIGNRAMAQNALERISYYRLSAYWHPFKRQDDTFEPTGTFEQALELYEYDRRLRLLVLDAVERIEVVARTAITYTLAHAHGAFVHENPRSFRPHFKYATWHAGLEKEIVRAKETFLDHFKASYDGFPRIPIWMAFEVMSLGTLSKMFEGMLADDQRAVSHRYGIHQTVLASWLHTLTVVRNVCAHHGRLWNRELGTAPKLPAGDPAWRRIPNNKRVYCIVAILLHLLKDHHGESDWVQQAAALLHEMDGQARWQRAMGLPADWATHPAWQAFAAERRSA
jgi:abortive infection bacteriophage resistance protein